jgi:hypothetical protein
MYSWRNPGYPCHSHSPKNGSFLVVFPPVGFLVKSWYNPGKLGSSWYYSRNSPGLGLPGLTRNPPGLDQESLLLSNKIK